MVVVSFDGFEVSSWEKAILGYGEAASSLLSLSCGYRVIATLWKVLVRHFPTGRR